MAACAAASRSAIAIHAASQPRAHPARLQIKLRPQLRVVTCDQAGAAAPAHPRWADWRQHLLTPPLQSGASAPWRQATLASSYRPRRDLERIWEASSSQKHEHTGSVTGGEGPGVPPKREGGNWLVRLLLDLLLLPFRSVRLVLQLLVAAVVEVLQLLTATVRMAFTLTSLALYSIASGAWLYGGYIFVCMLGLNALHRAAIDMALAALVATNKEPYIQEVADLLWLPIWRGGLSSLAQWVNVLFLVGAAAGVLAKLFDMLGRTA